MSTVRQVVPRLPVALALALLGTACSTRPSEDPPPWPFPHKDSSPPDGGPFSEPPSPDDAGPSPLEPALGAVVTAADPPPALSGGTLLATRDGRFVVAADPERDRVMVVDVSTPTPKGHPGTLTLERHDEPGRLVEDAAGRVHVVLRRGGALVTFDPATLAVVARRPVCAAPRGVAYDPRNDSVYVACGGGELVTLPAAGGASTRTVHLDADLRDVVVEGGRVHVTRFRAAELLTVDAEGHVASRGALPAVVDPFSRGRGGPVTNEPGVAWRAVAAPSGGVLMLHQRSQATAVEIRPGGYGGQSMCGTGVVQAAITPMGGATQAPQTPPLANAVLAIDLAVSPDGSEVAVAAPGNAPLVREQVRRFPLAAVTDTSGTPCMFGTAAVAVTGQVVAVAYTPAGALVAQTREPSSVVFVDTGHVMPLGGESRADSGHTIFHANAGGGVACASCHPEGREDGRVWDFGGAGRRRTQSLRGGLLGTEPFHWEGDMTSFDRLMTDVFGGRMSGGTLSAPFIQAASHWVDAQPPLPVAAPADVDAVARGRAVFEDVTVGCAGCHAGPRLTNNATVDVGTGGAFQVPSLRGLAWRAPYMHDGCAATLRDRFGACGGGDLHGHTSQLDPARLSDLVAYLASL